MNDDAIRASALNPRESFIVQAPAGSGKTQLLTARILSLLASGVNNPESVLAITFTRKASDEMKRRVMSALLLGKGPEPEKPHEKILWSLAVAVLKVDEAYGWGLLKNPQRLRIMTIDALCSSITHQLPLSSRLGVSPQSVEYARTLHIKAAQETLYAFLEERNPSLETLLLHLNNRQEKACEWIANMLASRDQWLPLIYSHDTQDLEKLRATLESNIASVIEDSFNQAMEKSWGVDWDGLALYLSYAASHQESDYLQQTMQSWINILPEITDFEQWRALCRWLCTSQGELRKTVDKRQGFPAASSFKDKDESKNAKLMKEGFLQWLSQLREDTDACDAIKELMALPDPVYSDRQWDVLKALFHLLPKAVERLQALFTLRGEADFTAVTRCALTALGGDEAPTDLDLKLDYALQHILVDEFQDTSATQFELIRRLVSHWDNDGTKTLFLVGDPMQSIYRFRQAEVGGFLQAQRYGVGPMTLKSLHLSSNFRSQKAIVDWINATMPAVFAKKDDIHLGAITYSAFEAQHTDDATAGVYLRRGGEIAVLKELIQQDSITSIAVLVRNRSHAETLLPALRAANIPYQAVEIEHITQTPCVRQLLQLTQAYLCLANSQAWISILMSPYCGLSMSDLTHLIALKPVYFEALLCWENAEGLSEEGRRILSRVAPILSAWIANRNMLSLPNAIEWVWFALGGPAALGNKESLLDAESYFNLLRECDQGGTIDVIDFEARLERLFSNAWHVAKIQIMTIHRAKGLEFDAVLIPSIDRQPRASDKPLLLWESCPIGMTHVFLFAPIHATQEDADPIYAFIWRKNRVREKHESARLLYVGLTRARKQLYLFSTEDPPAPNSFMGMLSKHVMLDTQAPIEDEDSAPTDLQPSFIPLSNTLHRLPVDWDNAYFPKNAMDKLLTERTSNPIDHENLAPSRYRDKALGILIHKELYLWAEHPKLMHQPIATHVLRWRTMLWEAGLPDDHLSWIAEVMQRIQSDPQAQYILAPHKEAKSEHEITTVINGSVKTYIIDRTFIDENGVRVIVDYKTGDMSEHYGKQLCAYANVMRTLESRDVRLCLYFPLKSELIDIKYTS